MQSQAGKSTILYLQTVLEDEPANGSVIRLLSPDCHLSLYDTRCPPCTAVVPEHSWLKDAILSTIDRSNLFTTASSVTAWAVRQTLASQSRAHGCRVTVQNEAEMKLGTKARKQVQASEH